MAEQLPTGHPCATCQRPMLAQAVYRANATHLNTLGYVQKGAGNDCNACYMRKRRQNPRPSTRRSHKATPPPIAPAIVAQYRAAAGLPPGGAS